MQATNKAIVLIEDDADNLSGLQMVLEEEHYPSIPAMTIQEALHVLDTAEYTLVICDLFGSTPEERLHYAQLIREHAFPTPVGILTAHRLANESPELQTFAFALEKPYDVNVLLTNIAACFDEPIPATLLPQATIIKRFFSALSARDWETILALSSDDIVYLSPHAGELRGKAAYRAYLEPRTAEFPQVRLIPLNIYATPTGLAVRYRAIWEATPGAEQSTLSASVFRFQGEQISQIGNRFPDKVHEHCA